MANDHEEMTLYLAACVVTSDDIASVRFGHFLGWLFNNESYHLIECFLPVASAKTKDYDHARLVAQKVAIEMGLPFVDAVEQHGTIKRKGRVSRLRERAAIATLAILINRVNAISKRLDEYQKNKERK